MTTLYEDPNAARQPHGKGANQYQVAGSHYQKYGKLQHWDIVAYFNLDYFQGCISKYLFRYKDKGGIQDLEKAKHYLEKYIELLKAEEHSNTPTSLKTRTVAEVVRARGTIAGCCSLFPGMDCDCLNVAKLMEDKQDA